MSYIYDEDDQRRPLAMGALNRFLSIQDRIGFILEDRLSTWHQAEHDSAPPYGSRLASVDRDGLHYEVQARDDWWPTGRFTVPLSILTDPGFEANCAAKMAARDAAVQGGEGRRGRSQEAGRTTEEARRRSARPA